MRARGATHPRDVQEVFDHGRVQSWGNTNTLNASTALLDGMHYRGLLRVVRRETGTRVYEAVDHAPADDAPAARHDRARRLLMTHRREVRAAAVGLAGLPRRSCCSTARRTCAARRARCSPSCAPACRRSRIDGVTWLWTPGEDPAAGKWRVDPERARLLAPFDPVVWDRRRFELLWGWAYKFEAYTPAARRTMGHYALPLLYGDQAVGWANADAGRQGAAGGALRASPTRPGRATRPLRAPSTPNWADMAEFLQLDRGAAVRLKRPRK